MRDKKIGQIKGRKERRATSAMLTILSAASLLLLIKIVEAEKEYYPDDYRNWYHVKSMIIEEGHPLYSAFGGIHHIYANKKAVEGYKKGKFEDGSVIVFDLLEVKKQDNTIQEGNRKVLAYMKKNSKLKETGGWEFRAFAGGDKTKQVVKDQKSECFSCHTQAENSDFVFSKIRE